MAKTKSVTFLKTFHSFSTVKKVVVVAGFTLIVSILSYTFVIRPYQVRQEKSQLLTAKVELSQIVTELEDAGLITNVVEDDSCGYSSAKFSKGTLSCRVGYDFLDKNNQQMIVSSISRLDQKKNETGFYTNYNIYSINEIACSLSFSKNDTSVDLFCSEYAMAEHFELR